MGYDNHYMLHSFGQNTLLLKALNQHAVDFIVVGGLAVSFHAPTREVDDLDLMISPEPENAQKVIDALRSARLKFSFTADRLIKSKVQIPLKLSYYADIVTPEDGFDYSGAMSKAHASEVNGVPVLIASVETLLELKATSRDKDIADVELLRGLPANDPAP